jgi:phosphoglycolate phosphatase-like HAD superfamily hydrolase
MTAAVAVDLDGALGDTRPLWDAFLDDAARRFRSIAELDPSTLPRDRGQAAALLDGWAAAGVGDWRGGLERFAEDHAPVYLRPDPTASAAVRGLAGAGARVGVFTDAPAELARVALAHLGVARRIEVLEAGSGAFERLLATLGAGTLVARTAGDLATITAGGPDETTR